MAPALPRSTGSKSLRLIKKTLRLLTGIQQILSDHCQTIASSYPESEREQYEAAAATFRIPYWDWASDPVMPDIVNAPTITIPTPNGVQTVSNPLLTYKLPQPLPASQFPSSESSGASDWYLAKDIQTYRSPNNQIGGPSNYAQANSALAANTLQYQAVSAMCSESQQHADPDYSIMR